MSERRIQAFFSYTHLDAKANPSIIQTFSSELELAVKTNLTNVDFEFWKDSEKLRIGDHWDEKIRNAIKKSDIIFILLTPKWIESIYCRKEYEIFSNEVEIASAVKGRVFVIKTHDIDRKGGLTRDQIDVLDSLQKRQHKPVYVSDFYTLSVNEKRVLIENFAREIVYCIKAQEQAAPDKERLSHAKLYKRIQEISASKNTFYLNDLIESSKKYLRSKIQFSLAAAAFILIAIGSNYRYHFSAFSDNLETKPKSVLFSEENGSWDIDYGDFTLASRWSDLDKFRSTLGQKFQMKLHESVTAAQNGKKYTWYIINFSPFIRNDTSATDEIKAAADKGIEIRMSYLMPDRSGDDPGRSSLKSAYATTFKFFYEKTGDTYKQDCEDLIDRIRRFEEIFSSWSAADEASRNAHNWKVYRNLPPTFYKIWLVVPTEPMELADTNSAPSGTFGFVMPYAYFQDYDNRPAFYFGAPSTKKDSRQNVLLNYYYSSTKKYFDRAEEYSYSPPSGQFSAPKNLVCDQFGFSPP